MRSFLVFSFAALLATTAVAVVAAFFDGSVTPSLVDRDFVNYWMGAHLALKGDQADLFSQRV